MVNFEKLGFDSFDEYKSTFFRTLLKTNQTYEYFVSWDRVLSNVKHYENELQILSILSRYHGKCRKNKLSEILKKYPEVSKVIPIIIAVRLHTKGIDIFDATSEKILTVIFDPKDDRYDLKTVVEFCERTGILDIFDRTHNLLDYILGVEVGLDTNARKNRSGLIFEQMVYNKISKIISKKVKIVPQDANFSLYEGRRKRHDFALYLEPTDKQPFMIIEANFYNTPGSKPNAIVGDYIELHRKSEEYGIIFVWITDGKGWLKMKNHMERAMMEMDWILNYKMLNRIVKIYDPLRP